MYTFINNDFVNAQDAVLPVKDLALNRGYGVFDFFKTLEGKPIFLREHLDRFYNSARQMRLPVPYTKAELLTILQDLLERNKLSVSGVRLLLTGGDSEDGYGLGKPNLVITQQTISLPDEIAFAKGIKLVSVVHQRQLPPVKTIDYLMPIWLQPLLAEKDADDLLYHYEGTLTECPRSNFFIVTADNRLVTAKEGILDGITRCKVLELAERHIAVEERAISLEEAKRAKEAFVTSTTKLILPVASIDGQAIGDDNREISRVLYNALNQRMKDHIASWCSSAQRMR
ncbi:MAG: amino acid aminotransferase [Flaviaesturariibacter sp.]|nr:amino acid aminotransferase [Flaviaesturariibacter sp.]